MLKLHSLQQRDVVAGQGVEPGQPGENAASLTPAHVASFHSPAHPLPDNTESHQVCVFFYIYTSSWYCMLVMFHAVFNLLIMIY